MYFVASFVSHCPVHKMGIEGTVNGLCEEWVKDRLKKRLVNVHS